MLKLAPQSAEEILNLIALTILNLPLPQKNVILALLDMLEELD